MTRIEEFAQAFAEAVHEAFSSPAAYGPAPESEEGASVQPSWSANEVRLGWHRPDPRVVVVGTEYAWIQDPWSTSEDNRIWDAAADYLTRQGWGDVHWESINPAVHIMYIDFPQEWAAVLMKQALEKRK